MEVINSIGFVNFWGVTPCYNIFETEKEKLKTSKEINVLISNSNDIRHILKTLHQTQGDERPRINFYIYETSTENLARSFFFLHLLHDRSLSVKDRVEIFMEVYGNTLLSTKSAEYLNLIYKALCNFITGDKKYKGVLDSLVDLSGLTHKERDDILEIFLSWDNKLEYDIEKYRDDRVRYMLKDRYDHRKNLFDWDYHMNMTKFAPLVKLQHYQDFRNTGISFMLRLNKYNIPNRTLSSYIQGREKVHKGSCMVRGFWGDIVNSPFISFGLELNTKEEHDHFHKNNMINYIYDSQEVTEYNLIKILMKMDKNEDYDYTIREKERNQIQTESTIDKNPTEMASGSNNEPMNSDNTLNDSVTMDYSLIASEPMIGFKNIRLIPLSGSLENILKKKKYRNLFDFIIIGLHSKCFVDKAKEILSPEGKVFIELNTYMTSFTEKQKEEYASKLKEMATQSGMILEDTSSKYIWKFFYSDLDLKNNLK